MYVPNQGYVGVGCVVNEAKSIKEFNLIDKESGIEHPITQVVSSIPSMDVPEDEVEYYVSINWIKTVSLDEAIRERGFFANQNIVAHPRARKWILTIGRLKTLWNVSD